MVLVVVALAFTGWLLAAGHAPRTSVGVALVVVVVVVLVPRVEPGGVRGLLLRLAGPVPGGRG
ncbi:hypothetical protein [Saccharothrix sp. HUAS TT1]|uniref:hypothetical protein n=1 Tax=unclassified Saccharothrix TaxID=2593673 RepID=UPI00345C31C9